MKRIVTEIKAAEKSERLLRVAAYCRVSTVREAQLFSLRSQKIHYESLIAEHPDWEFAGIYYEEGLSGTHKENRPELQRLLADCKAGRIDLVLTKSISRFARNTTDCLEMVRALTGSGVDIYFEKEKLHTGVTGGELILTILALFAEFEAESISGNAKWALEKRSEKGQFHLSRAPYGYRLQEGKLVVDPKEAAIVRYIFECVLAGKGTPTIAAELNRRQIPTKRGGIWHPGTLQGMLRNVVYTGDLLVQKTWRDEKHQRRMNRGEVHQFLIRGDHEAIIPEEVFTAAAGASRQRGLEVGNLPVELEDAMNSHLNRYCFTGRIVCGECGDAFRRQMARRADGSHAFWACKRHLQHACDCCMGKIWEEDLQCTFINLQNKLFFSQKFLLVPYMQAIEGIFCREAKALQAYLKQLQKPVHDFFDEIFDTYVDHVLVKSAKKVAYHLTCGLELDEYIEYRV